MSHPRYDVDENGIIYFGDDYLVPSTDKNMTIIKKSSICKRKKKKQKRKQNKQKSNITYNDSHTASYYFNRVIDIVGAEFFSFCPGSSLNYLFSTNLRNWGKIIPSRSKDSSRWKLFEKDAVDRIQKLVHHYRKLYSYFDRKPDPYARFNQRGRGRGRGRGGRRGRGRGGGNIIQRTFREGYNSPLLLFAVYDLNDITNKKTVNKINKININDLLQNHLFQRKQFLQYVSGNNCLHFKTVLYLYLNAMDDVRSFKHNNFAWGSHKLLPIPTPTFQEIQHEELIARRMEMIENGESVQNLPPIKPFELSVKDKILQHEEVQMKMWIHNFNRIENLDDALRKLVIHEPHKYYAKELMRINQFKQKNKYYFENAGILKKYKYVNPKNSGFKYLKRRHFYNQKIAEFMKREYNMSVDKIFEDNLEVKSKSNRRLSKLTLHRIKYVIDFQQTTANTSMRELNEIMNAFKLAYEYYAKDTTEIQISYEKFVQHLNELRVGTSRVEMELIVHRAFDKLGYPGDKSKDIMKYWISLPTTNEKKSKCQFKLVIIPKWFNIFKYIPEWRRFNKQLREYFCPNLLRIRLLYLFITNDDGFSANTKGTLFGWTYNNRILVFQALLSDVSRS